MNSVHYFRGRERLAMLKTVVLSETSPNHLTSIVIFPSSFHFIPIQRPVLFISLALRPQFHIIIISREAKQTHPSLRAPTMDFDIATRRLKQDQRAAYAKVRASQRAQKASASARRAAAASKLDAERRLLQKKLESEKHDRILDHIDGLVRRVEREALGVRNVSAATPPPPFSISSTGMPSTTAATDAIEQSIGMKNAVDESNQQQQQQKQQQHHQSRNPSSSIRLETTNNGLSSSFFAKGFTLSATSIHGAGDKITLPPSVLETLFVSENNDMDPWDGISSKNGRPIAFRIGIRNADYIFPSSEKMKTLVECIKKRVDATIITSSNALAVAMHESTTTKAGLIKNNDDGDYEDEDEAIDKEDHTYLLFIDAYMAELSYRYLSYTHGTVVEFTEEEGHVGLPEPVAKALLQRNIHSLVGGGGELVNIPVRRTVDAAAIHDDNSDKNHHHHHPNDSMDIDFTANTEEIDKARIREGGGENHADKTPGHPAYGLFDIPALPIEVIPIHNLPPGKQCTFTPTLSSIQNGFYNLKDVKLVLEQSLMRTRATLSRGDVIRTWRRGVSFDLIVSSLEPGQFGVVSCVNTDMNVDIGPPDGEDSTAGDSRSVSMSDRGGDDDDNSLAHIPLGGGRLLSKESSPMPHATRTNIELVLPPEPGVDMKKGVCDIQIHGRTSSGSMITGRRRFLVESTTMKELFAFASQSCCEGADPMTFRLVTRFPRTVFALSSPSSSLSLGGSGFDGNMTLESAGIEGQEMFMVEMI